MYNTNKVFFRATTRLHHCRQIGMNITTTIAVINPVAATISTLQMTDDDQGRPDIPKRKLGCIDPRMKQPS